MAQKPKSARVLSPWKIVGQEMTARGWGFPGLSRRTGIPATVLTANYYGDFLLTRNDASRLAEAFSTSEDLWLELEKNYRNWLEESTRKGAFGGHDKSR